jgi:hypothetical protein
LVAAPPRIGLSVLATGLLGPWVSLVQPARAEVRASVEVITDSLRFMFKPPLGG